MPDTVTGVKITTCGQRHMIELILDSLISASSHISISLTDKMGDLAWIVKGSNGTIKIHPKLLKHSILYLEPTCEHLTIKLMKDFDDKVDKD